jgi:hypothetical protein
VVETDLYHYAVVDVAIVDTYLWDLKIVDVGTRFVTFVGFIVLPEEMSKN